MIVTFAVMLLSGMGQPALLYLVPFTLTASAVVAACRGEMRQFWAGTTYMVRRPVSAMLKVILYSFSQSGGASCRCFLRSHRFQCISEQIHSFMVGIYFVHHQFMKLSKQPDVFPVCQAAVLLCRGTVISPLIKLGREMIADSIPCFFFCRCHCQCLYLIGV